MQYILQLWLIGNIWILLLIRLK